MITKFNDFLNEGKEEYQKFFNSKLEKYGVKSPSELDDDKKKEFFDEIEKEWKGDKPTNESEIILNESSSKGFNVGDFEAWQKSQSWGKDSDRRYSDSDSKDLDKHKFKLGDIVAYKDTYGDGKDNVGVVLQLHSFKDGELRTDSDGNQSIDSCRYASKDEIKKYYPELLKWIK